jgi:hypothetical protein
MTRKTARRLVLLAVAGLVLAQGAALAADPLRITKPVNATKEDLDPQRTWAAPYLLVHPDNPKVIVAGTMEFRKKQCTLMRSIDGGATWKFIENPPVLQSYPFCLANNSNIFQAPLAFGRNNTLYMGSLGWDVQDTRSKASVVLHRSTNLGDTWTSSMVRDARPTQDPKQESNRPVTGVVVDSTSGSDDIVYVSWRTGLQNQPTGSSAPSHAMVAVSRDGGRTFGPPINMDEGVYREGGARESLSRTGTTIGGTTTTTAPANSLAAQPNQEANFGSGNNGLAISDKGVVYAAWPTSASNQGAQRLGTGLYLTASQDQGKTWEKTLIRPASHEIRGNVQLAWGSKGGSEGTLHLVYEGTRQPTVASEADIWYQRSTDGGKTWSEPKTINDDDPRLLNGQYVPMIRTAPNGRVDIAWWDTRDDPGIRANDVYYAYSTDNGQSWSKNTRITDQTIDRRFGVWGQNFDQNSPPGLASINEYALLSWDDTRMSRGEDGPVLAQDPNAEGLGYGGGVQDIFVGSVQFAAIGASGASKTAKIILAGVVGLLAVGLILLVVALASRRRAGEPTIPRRERVTTRTPTETPVR